MGFTSQARQVLVSKLRRIWPLIQKTPKGLLSAGLGYTTHSGWDVGARYESFTGQSYDYGLIALRIAYGFTL